MITGKLKSQVDKIWLSFHTGGITNPISVIEQFTYLLFIRRLDEEQLKEEKKEVEFRIPMKKVLFTEAQKPLRWNQFKNEDPETMFDRFSKPTVDGMTVFDHLKGVGKEGGVFAEFMEKAQFTVTTPRLLDQVVQLIDQIDMDNRDTKGDLYEYMLGKTTTSGDNGQFRTPRHIIRMMVDMVQPKKDDVICDPSSGTSGFLIGASDYLRDNHEDLFHEKGFQNHFQNDMFHGIELDPTMVRIGAMNLQLHGIENPQLQRKDTLSEAAGDIRNRYTLMLANPPFKGSLDADAVEASILDIVKSKKTELLFLGAILRMMKTGGRCAVIVPDGIAFGSNKGHVQIKKELVSRHKLEAVVSMPSGIFKPYAGVSTCVFVFTKTGTGGTDNVWFYDMQADGFSLNDNRNPIEANDIPDIVNRYHNRADELNRARTERSFMVPADEIESNNWDLSINRYKEVVYEEVEYAPPMEIIAEIANLKSMLG
jgi:type I restriction enzyme M protein